jgi:hypothetical protein
MPWSCVFCGVEVSGPNASHCGETGHTEWVAPYTGIKRELDEETQKKLDKTVAALRMEMARRGIE